MTALAALPPVLPPPARCHLGTARGLRTTPGPVDIAHAPAETARGLGESVRVPLAVVGPHVSTPAHVGTVPGPVTAPIAQLTARGHGSVSIGLDERVAGSTRAAVLALVFTVTLGPALWFPSPRCNAWSASSWV